MFLSSTELSTTDRADNLHGWLVQSEKGAGASWGSGVARINIEDSLWKEPAFQDLMIRVGNRHMAKGMVIELFTLAQEFWFPDKKLIPKDRVVSSGLSEAVQTGLAEEREGGIYVRGSEAAFDWLFQKQLAGKNSGESRRRKKRTKQGERALTGVQQASTSANGCEPLTPSPSLTPSPFSSSGSFFSKGEVADATAHIVGVKNPVGLFIARYVTAYKRRYGEDARPDLRGKVQGQIRLFVTETPMERACEMIETYCEMDDAWFLTKAHDFGTFVENLSKVGLKLDTGRSITRLEINEHERRKHSSDSWDEAAKILNERRKTNEAK